MKTLKQLIAFAMVLTFTSVTSQQLQQKMEMKIDALGNAKIIVSMTMNAQQWQVWLSNLGNNPTALKREIERGMPAYFLDDFKLEKDDMNRSFSLSLNAHGVCEINKRGTWTIDTDQKNAHVTELTKRKYMLVSSPPELGGTVQQTYILEFPDEASDIKIDKDAYGKSIFKFEMDGPGTGFRFLSWAGIALILVGGGGTWFKMKKQKLITMTFLAFNDELKSIIGEVKF